MAEICATRVALLPTVFCAWSQKNEKPSQTITGEIVTNAAQETAKYLVASITVPYDLVHSKDEKDFEQKLWSRFTEPSTAPIIKELNWNMLPEAEMNKMLNRAAPTGLTGVFRSAQVGLSTLNAGNFFYNPLVRHFKFVETRIPRNACNQSFSSILGRDK